MALLTGMTPDGTEVPVQVDPSGRLVAEGLTGPQGAAGSQGVQGEKGDKGEQGVPGIPWSLNGADAYYTGGRVAIGTASAGSYTFNQLVVGSSGDQGITIASGTANTGSLAFADGTVGSSAYSGLIQYSHTDDFMRFFTLGTERFRCDSSGRLLVGTSTSRSVSGAERLVQIEGTSAVTTGLSISRNSNDSSPSFIGLAKTRGTFNGSVSSVQSNDLLGAITFSGADGSSLVNAVDIRGEVDGTPGTNDMPGRLVFSTTADGASSPKEAMRIDSKQRVCVKSPNGSWWALQVSDAGAVSAIAA